MDQNPYESPREESHDGPVRLSEAAVAFYSIADGLVVFAVAAAFTFWLFYAM